MGWSISIKKTKTETKYKIHSSITGSYITKKWMTKNEIIKFLFWSRFDDFVTEFIKDSMCFPNGWGVKDNFPCRINEDPNAISEYHKLIEKSFKDDKIILDKFTEELNKIGIKIQITDEKNSFKN